MNIIFKYILIIILLKFNLLIAAPLEIDITEGRIEPLPIAVTKFNYDSIQGKVLSNNIFNVISNNLLNSGLFKQISNKAFLQSEEEVFSQPIFKDWSLIDANLIVSGLVSEKEDKLLAKIKLWDVYRERLILSKKIDESKSKIFLSNNPIIDYPLIETSFN